MKVIELETNQVLGTLSSINELEDPAKRFIWDRFVEKTNYLVIKNLTGDYEMICPSRVRLEQ